MYCGGMELTIGGGKKAHGRIGLISFLWRMCQISCLIMNLVSLFKDMFHDSFATLVFGM